METDASGIAISGVLTQHGRPVAVTSKRLSTAEQSCSAVELEALATVYCASKFRQFLIGRPVVLYTDQRALSFLSSSSVKSTCKNNELIRWRTELSEYNFRIAYKPGKENLRADAFSRAFGLQSVKSLFTIELFRQVQEEDNELSTLRSSLENQLRPAEVSLGLWSNRKRMQVLQGVLCLVESGNVRVLCPGSLRLAVLERTHSKFGHPGVQATLLLIREGFYWVDLRQEVEHHIESGGVCAETRPRFEKPEDGTLVTSTQPFERLSLDFIGPKATRPGEMKRILTVVDEYSRYLEALVVEHPDSETVIDVLSNQVFARYGLPNKVHSDRGKAFMSTDIQQFLDGCGIEISHSSKYNPAGNGQNEGYNGELQRLITRIVRENSLDSLDWQQCLGEALFILRSRVCESSGSSPHDLFFFPFRRRYFAGSDLKLLANDADFRMSNFVRVKRTDPHEKDKGLLTDLFSPQLAEIRTPKGTEYVNTRHLAPAPSDKECHPEVAEGSPTVTATSAKYPTATSKKPPVSPARVFGSDNLVLQLSPTVRP